MEQDEKALRDQLANGTAPERVAAAWELALRTDAATELRAHLAREPSAGARRHLTVVLAGLGEKDAVRVLAEHDPDHRVRATAVGIAARTSAHGTDLQEWLAERLCGDPTAELAHVILDCAPDVTTAPLAAAIDGLSRHATTDVREALVSRYERVGGPRSVVEVALSETDRALRARLAWLARAHDSDLLPRLDVDTVRAVAARAGAEGVALRWAELAQLASHPEHLDDVLVIAAAGGHENVPLSWLLAYVHERWLGPAEMETIASRCEREALGEVDRARLVRWVEDLRAAFAEDVVHDDSYPPSPEQVEVARGIIARIDALLVAK